MQNLDGIDDILPPPAPAADGFPPGILAAIVLIALAVALLLRFGWRGWRLRLLARRYSRGVLDGRETLNRLAADLVRHLNLARIACDRPPDLASAQAWRDYIARLQAARFARCAPDREVVLDLIAGARHWLERSRG